MIPCSFLLLEGKKKRKKKEKENSSHSCGKKPHDPESEILAQSCKWKSRKSSPNKSCAIAPPDLLSRASSGYNLEADKWKWNCCRNCSGWFNRWNSPSNCAVSAWSRDEAWRQMDGPSVNPGQRKSQRWKSFGWGKSVYQAIMKYFTNSFYFAHLISNNKNKAEGRRHLKIKILWWLH